MTLRKRDGPANFKKSTRLRSVENSDGKKIFRLKWIPVSGHRNKFNIYPVGKKFRAFSEYGSWSSIFSHIDVQEGEREISACFDFPEGRNCIF